MTNPASRSEKSGKRPPGRRARMRAAGLRPIHIWAPDIRNPAVAERIRADVRALAKHEPGGDDAMDWVEAVYEWPKE